jgi:hypothetical protein
MNRILVTGDVVVDHHIYEGQRFTPSASDQRGVKVVKQHGGAKGLADLINAVISQWRTEKVEREKNLQNAKEALKGVRLNSKNDKEIANANQSVADAKGRLVPPSQTDWSAQFGLTLPSESADPCPHHALAIWKPFPEDPSNPENKRKVWRADLLMGYGHQDSSTGAGDGYCADHKPEPIKSKVTPNLLVLDDGGFVFRDDAHKTCWFLPDDDDDLTWIILKMSSPVCRGDLWDSLKKGKYNKRLIVVVSAQDLRQECVRLRTGLSWERTVEELYEALQSDQSNPLLKELATIPRHLLVIFSGDGTLWLNNSDPKQPKATLIYDASGAEGAWAPQFEGQAFGYLSCMVAALVSALMLNSKEPKLESAIRTGLSVMRDLHKLGHGRFGEETPAGFPVKRLAEVIVRGGGDFSATQVPWTEEEWAVYAKNPDLPGNQRPWRIVEMSYSPFGSYELPSLLGLATQVVLQGEAAIKRLPHARFGELLTADRFEIEFLRSLRRLMMNYSQDRKAKKPLSIGIFGPPGAGKSFGVKQISNSIFGEKAWKEFNLSQFKDVGDLIGAFHQVRDSVLSGSTPVVFWDEFDSREYFWLQFLLAPMQDGRFQEGQVNHAIGKCVFIFAGATSFTFNEFGPSAPRELKKGKSYTAQKTEALKNIELSCGIAGWSSHFKTSQEVEALKDIQKALDDFRLKKGPDFHSRLDGYFDVLGPNTRSLPADSGNPFAQREPDKNDVCVPLRRALLIRSKLGVSADKRLDFDADLLNALLRIPEYLHGARSLEKLVLSLKPSKEGQPIRRSALPPPAQLAMYINDVPKFNDILNQNLAIMQSQIMGPLPGAIHETWRKLSQEEGWKMQPHLNKPYEDLEEVDKEENRAAARRIPEILALAGLKLEKKETADQLDDPGVSDHLEYHIERLAEAEHDSWMEHRKKNGWQYHKYRDDLLKRHPALLPYEKLSENDKKKDRNSVRHFSNMVHLAGYRITRTL